MALWCCFLVVVIIGIVTKGSVFPQVAHWFIGVVAWVEDQFVGVISLVETWMRCVWFCSEARCGALVQDLIIGLMDRGRYAHSYVFLVSGYLCSLICPLQVFCDLFGARMLLYGELLVEAF